MTDEGVQAFHKQLSAWHACFSVSHHGKRYITSWGRFDESPQVGQWKFSFAQKIVPQALKLPGSPTTSFAWLVTDTNLSPLQYIMRGPEQGAELTFGPEGQVHTESSDGSIFDTSIEGADFLLAGNMLPQLDLLTRFLCAHGRLPWSGRLYSPNSLHAFDYRLNYDGNMLESNLAERMFLSSEGSVVKFSVENSDLEFSLCDEAFPDQKTDVAVTSPKRDQMKGEAGTVSVDRPDITIMGKVRVPEKHSPTGVLLFLGGSGSFDCDGKSTGLDLGYGAFLEKMSNNGFVTYCFDKRGAGRTPLGREGLDMTYETFMADNLATFQFVAKDAEQRGLPLVLVGHSQGGLVALELAGQFPGVSAIVLLAAAGRPMPQVIADQIKAHARELGTSTEKIDAMLEQSKEFFCLITADQSVDEDIDTPEWFKVFKHSRGWYQGLLARDPVSMIKKIPCPIFIAQGGHDDQVSTLDAEMLCDEGQKSGCDIRKKIYPAHNHLFQEVAAGAYLDSYDAAEGKFADPLSEDIKAWLSEKSILPR